MELRVVIIWWMVCLLWSSTFLFIKIGLAHIEPFTFAWVRLTIAAAVLVPIALARGNWRAWTPRDFAYVGSAGVLLLGFNYGLLFWGTQFVPSALVAILQSGTPMIALVFGWMLGSEAVDTRKLVALIAGMAGVVVIFGAEARASGTAGLVGSAAVFGGSVCVAFAYVWLKTHGQRLSRSAIAATQTLAGLVPLACLGMLVEGAPSPQQWNGTAWLAVMYLAVFGSVVAFWLNYWLLQRMDTSAMLMMGVAEVPIAVALGAVVLGERLPAGTLVGGLFVLAGVIATLRRRAAAA